ncbi:MAG: uracil-DNA glycosylase family protein [Flavisolibacter sp.]
MTNWDEQLISFYNNLNPPQDLPGNINWLFPQKDPAVMKVVSQFLHKYYHDNKPRKLMLGINPGRFGAGVTGVNFTAPKQLETYCSIEHHFKKQTELSAEFIYEMIEGYGGVSKFYDDFFIGSVCPLGFVQNGKNLNYYDDKLLLAAVEPFIIRNLQTLINMNIDGRICFSIGGEKNYKYLVSLNKRFGWFQNIVALPHPRFIMQYRRKQKEEFIQRYLELITK